MMIGRGKRKDTTVRCPNNGQGIRGETVLRGETAPEQQKRKIKAKGKTECRETTKERWSLHLKSENQKMGGGEKKQTLSIVRKEGNELPEIDEERKRNK